eukprot:snap_masked-scaffold_6-processed-gene-4.33-mRNA-1 protein AED:1.00 eAED:1.00 QI:0/0/0/0/1/1/2/0/60
MRSQLKQEEFKIQIISYFKKALRLILRRLGWRPPYILIKRNDKTKLPLKNNLMQHFLPDL